MHELRTSIRTTPEEMLKDANLPWREVRVTTYGKEALSQSGFKYITALTNTQIRKLLKEKVIQWDLFDTTVCEVEQEGVRLTQITKIGLTCPVFRYTSARFTM